MHDKSIKFLFFISYSICFLLFGSCGMSQDHKSKFNGLSLVASPNKINQESIVPLLRTNANSVAIMPFGFLRNLASSDLLFDNGRQWWGETSEGTAETIRLCKKEGLTILLKPQIWVGGGEFTGKIEMKTEEDWEKLEISYSKFILNFAKIAELEQVELFSIGTELERFVAERPDYWRKLITEIRQIYSGKLTYAENWDCYAKPTFLAQLDYIGVDAYFPLSEEMMPSKSQIQEGWLKHKAELKACSEKFDKPILFTECGYRSMNYAAAKPWEFHTENGESNEKLQADLLEVMFELWSEDWLAGGFIWKWFANHEKSGGKSDTQFTPQNKLAEKTIADFFKK